MVGEFIGDDFGRGTECNDEDCALGLFAGFFDDQIAFFKGIFGRANDSFDAGCVVEKIVSDSETGKFPFNHDNIFIGPERSDLAENLNGHHIVPMVGIRSGNGSVTVSTIGTALRMMMLCSAKKMENRKDKLTIPGGSLDRLLMELTLVRAEKRKNANAWIRNTIPASRRRCFELLQLPEPPRKFIL